MNKKKKNVDADVKVMEKKKDLAAAKKKKKIQKKKLEN